MKPSGNRKPISAYEKAMHLLSIRAHTKKELQIKLKQRQYSSLEIETAIQKLEAQGFLNEEEFVQTFIQSYSHKGNVFLKNKLLQLGIPAHTIEAHLLSLEEEIKNAYQVAQKKQKTLQKKIKNPDKLREKLHSFLTYRGFSYPAIQEVLSRLI